MLPVGFIFNIVDVIFSAGWWASDGGRKLLLIIVTAVASLLFSLLVAPAGKVKHLYIEWVTYKLIIDLTE